MKNPPAGCRRWSFHLADLAAKVNSLRAKWPWFDRAVATIEHYGHVNGNLLAGGVTFFGFLSFFPILALGFAVAGWISAVYPAANDNLTTAIQQIFPGIVSTEPAPGKISLQQIQESSPTAGIIGLAGILYAGLGWITALRQAMAAVFRADIADRPNFIKGKLIDLMMLTLIGTVLVVSVGFSSLVSALAGWFADLIGLDNVIGAVLLFLIGTTLAIAASTVLFFVIYRLLGRSAVAAADLWSGALLAAIGFEILKLIVVNIVGGVGGSAFAPLALAITLLVWINYFARLSVYGAAWSYTGRRS